ncbi:DUF3307 domain-containing protein [Streptomyces pinistramenti]|uniref:DUF3307 domain-containing protein n=1 Tax=Streptomyces pinistramenti TaxID=2884812 RepID=UPI001D08BA74|nr:DUF3307 domain-containing protein [Streptomyces pinistramenti]MCB5910352.1 DUF3307 domain-containing protein [Streptomyces pinistramenti]
MFPSLFILMYVAHLLSDYPFQTDRQAGCKAGWTEGDTDENPGRYHHGWGPNLVHAGTHVLTTGVALALGVLVLGLPLTVPAAAAGLLWIGGTHAVIDRRWPVRWWMETTGQRDFVKHGGLAHVDQAAHLTALAVAALALTGLS